MSEFDEKQRHGSPTFYALLKEMEDLHDRKSHDYAPDNNPFGNYHFAGILSQLFDNSMDAGFIGRIGEKLYRLANLENTGKVPNNETVEDTEKDIAVIIMLWLSDRRDRRKKREMIIAEQKRTGVLLNQAYYDRPGIMNKPDPLTGWSDKREKSD